VCSSDLGLNEEDKDKRGLEKPKKWRIYPKNKSKD
jgi:hypothetical protein